MAVAVEMIAFHLLVTFLRFVFYFAHMFFFEAGCLSTTNFPTSWPTAQPTAHPSAFPSHMPSAAPTVPPFAAPSLLPTVSSSVAPSAAPTPAPSSAAAAAPAAPQGGAVRGARNSDTQSGADAALIAGSAIAAFIVLLLVSLCGVVLYIARTRAQLNRRRAVEARNAVELRVNSASVPLSPRSHSSNRKSKSSLFILFVVFKIENFCFVKARDAQRVALSDNH